MQEIMLTMVDIFSILSELLIIRNQMTLSMNLDKLFDCK
jgi:hypothetical protein